MQMELHLRGRNVVSVLPSSCPLSLLGLPSVPRRHQGAAKRHPRAELIVVTRRGFACDSLHPARASFVEVRASDAALPHAAREGYVVVRMRSIAIDADATSGH